MKEQFLKILYHNINAMPLNQGNSIAGIIPSAEEIQFHVMEFMWWLNWGKCESMPFFHNYDKSIFENINDINEYSLEEVYQYWLTNIKS